MMTILNSFSKLHCNLFDARYIGKAGIRKCKLCLSHWLFLGSLAGVFSDLFV